MSSSLEPGAERSVPLSTAANVEAGKQEAWATDGRPVDGRPRL